MKTPNDFLHSHCEKDFCKLNDALCPVIWKGGYVRLFPENHSDEQVEDLLRVKRRKVTYSDEEAGQLTGSPSELARCEHKRTKIWEPHLAGARKCLDCDMVYNPNMSPQWQNEKAETIVSSDDFQKTWDVIVNDFFLIYDTSASTANFTTVAQKFRELYIEFKTKYPGIV